MSSVAGLRGADCLLFVSPDGAGRPARKFLPVPLHELRWREWKHLDVRHLHVYPLDLQAKFARWGAPVERSELKQRILQLFW